MPAAAPATYASAAAQVPPAARATTAATAVSAASQPAAATPAASTALQPSAAPAASAVSQSPAAPAARRQATQKRKRRDRVTVSVSVGYVEIEGRGELVGRGTGRMHVVRLADVVAGVRRTSKRRRGGRVDIGAVNVNAESCFPKGEEKQGLETDSDRDTDAATADGVHRKCLFGD